MTCNEKPILTVKLNLMLAATLVLSQQVLLTEANYEEIKAQILPPALLETADKVPWTPDLWTAVVRANHQDKPVLLWVMNGHPLACT